MAVVGGTAAELGGGKFANGAKMFGFMRLFRKIPDCYRRRVGFELDIGPGGEAVQKTNTIGNESILLVFTIGLRIRKGK